MHSALVVLHSSRKEGQLIQCITMINDNGTWEFTHLSSLGNSYEAEIGCCTDS